MMHRTFALVGLLCLLVVPVPIMSALAQDEEGVEAATLDGYLEGVGREYTPSSFLGDATPDPSTYQGAVGLLVEVSRFVDASSARNAYDILVADRATSIQRLLETEELEVSNRQQEDVASLGDAAVMYDFMFSVPDEDIRVDLRYLLVLSGDLVFELVAFAVGAEYLDLANDVAGVMIEREIGAEEEEVALFEGTGGMFELFPEPDDPVLNGMEMTGFDIYQEPEDAATPSALKQPGSGT